MLAVKGECELEIGKRFALEIGSGSVPNATLKRNDGKTASERNTIATTHLWHQGDFTSPRLGFPRDQDGMVHSKSEEAPKGQMVHGTRMENEANNVNIFLSRWAIYEGRIDTSLSSTFHSRP